MRGPQASLLLNPKHFSESRQTPTCQIEDLEVTQVSHEVRRAGRAGELSPKEYALPEFLLRNSGHPVTRAAIIEEVWRIHGDSITNVVDVYINYLRRNHPLIRTVRGVGYQIGGNHRAG